MLAFGEFQDWTAVVNSAAVAAALLAVDVVYFRTVERQLSDAI